MPTKTTDGQPSLFRVLVTPDEREVVQDLVTRELRQPTTSNRRARLYRSVLNKFRRAVASWP